MASNTPAAAPGAIGIRAISGPATVTPVPPRNLSGAAVRVKRGDTLSSIARLFDTTVARIRSWNRLAGSHIAPGDRLKILAVRAR